MGPNAARILYRLGLGEGLDRDGVRPLGTHQRRWDDGRTLQQAPLNPLCDELYGAPHLTIHRADLLAIIAAGLSDRAHPSRPPTDRLRRPAATVSRRWFDNGARIAADVLVGADGIHSTVRALLFGDEAPQFAGCVAYRGLVPVERIADLGLERGNQSWLGPGAHFVHYFVSRGRLLNFVGWTEHDTWNREDWTDRATVERALAAFEGWHPQIRRIISAAETCFIWALFDRDPLPRWSVGRVDAARRRLPPDVPVHGAGRGAGDRGRRRASPPACRRAGGDPAAALRRYEQLRLPRVTRLQADVARQQAPLPYARRPGAAGARRRDGRGPRPRARESMQWLFGFDAGAVEAACGRGDDR